MVRRILKSIAGPVINTVVVRSFTKRWIYVLTREAQFAAVWSKSIYTFIVLLPVSVNQYEVPLVNGLNALADDPEHVDLVSGNEEPIRVWGVEDSQIW